MNEMAVTGRHEGSRGGPIMASKINQKEILAQFYDDGVYSGPV